MLRPVGATVGYELDGAVATLTLDRPRRLNAIVPVLIEDLEAGESVLLDPLELASMCHSTEDQRRVWLRTGPYAEPDE